MSAPQPPLIAYPGMALFIETAAVEKLTEEICIAARRAVDSEGLRVLAMSSDEVTALWPALRVLALATISAALRQPVTERIP